MMTDSVRSLLEAAIRAPSGENVQPWQFVVRENNGVSIIDVRVTKEREQSLYGWGERASLVAVGAALENIRIAATREGFLAQIDTLPIAGDPHLAARVHLSPGASAKDPLYDAIFRRSTNRKAYAKTLLTDSEITALKNEALKIGGEVRFATSEDEKKKLAFVGSCNERIMLGNPVLHQFFFSHVNWSKADDDRKKTGFFIDTLELAPPAKVGFKVMSVWSRARFLNKFLKFNKVAAGQNAVTYASCAAFGAIVSDSESPKDAIEAGRTMQRVWLEATHLGLSMQPMVGVVYLALATHAGETSQFSPDDIKLIGECDEIVRSTFSLGAQRTYFMFRIGRASAPSARAVRFSVEEVTTYA